MSTPYAVVWELAEKVCNLLDGQTHLVASEVLRKAKDMIAQTNIVSTINNETFNSQIKALQQASRDIGESIP